MFLRHHLAGCKDLVNMEIGVLETLVGGIRRMGTDVLRMMFYVFQFCTL